MEILRKKQDKYMPKYLLGDFIKETRTRQGYSQEDICFNICTTASLSRIENGKQIPGRCILDKLLERLGTENNVFNIFISKEDMIFYEAVQEMVRSMADENFEELEKQIHRMEKMTKGASELERQYLYFAKAELLWRKGESKEDAWNMLMKAIHVTLPQFDGKNPLRNTLLTFDEIMIINSIAVKNAKENKIDIALGLELWLKEHLEERMFDGKQKTAKYPVIIYNLSNWMGKMGRFSEALEMSQKGVEFCIKYGNLTSLPRLLFNQACALAELKEIDAARKCFQQSAVIFETMKQYEKAQMTTDWCKTHYNIEF